MKVMLSLHKKLTCYLQLDYAFRTNLDNFCSTVSHGKRTGVETRGGREEEQLAHLVHATGKQIHKELSFLNLAVTYLLKIKIKLDYMIVKKKRVVKGITAVYQPPLSKCSLITNGDQSLLCR